MRLTAIATVAAVGGLLAAEPSRAAAIIYDFPVPVGSDLSGPLVQDSTGALYGVTEFGGSANYGTVFRLNPPASPHAAWTQTTLYSFVNQADGYYPFGSLTLGPDGSVYGTTTYGGAFGASAAGGTVFQLTPPQAGQTSWTKVILHNFVFGDGDLLQGGLLLLPDGTLSGSAPGGGTISSGCGDYGVDGGCGTIFRLQPPLTAGQSWTFTRLFAFDGAASGGAPGADLIADSDGSLFGTDSGSGTQPGHVFILHPGEPGWTIQEIYTFQGGADGDTPVALIRGKNDMLYGTTEYGGLFLPACPVQGCGTVFALQRPVQPGISWQQSVLYRFGGRPDGALPDSSLVLDQFGTLYGTTIHGGSPGPTLDKAGAGIAFSLSPPTSGQGSWTEKGMTAGKIGFQPYGLSLDNGGILHGTLSSYSSGGSVFALPAQQLR